MLLVTVEELAAHLGVEFSAEEEARPEQAIAGASAVIQRYCNLVGLTRRVDHTITLRGVWGPHLTLPAGPVVSVAAVEIGGTPINDWWLVRDDLVRHGGWGGTSTEVQVTYTHGFEAVPADVKAVCLEVVARGWVNPSGVRSETIDGYSVTYIGSAETGMLWPGDREALAPYHRSAAIGVRS